MSCPSLLSVLPEIFSLAEQVSSCAHSKLIDTGPERAESRGDRPAVMSHHSGPSVLRYRRSILRAKMVCSQRLHFVVKLHMSARPGHNPRVREV